MKIVLDTNVFVSAILTNDGNAYLVLQHVQRRRITLALSKAIVDELGRVLHKPQLRKRHRWTDAQISHYLANLVDISEIVAVSETLELLKTDPTDSFILDCAVRSRADFIVSGDPHLRDLHSYRGIPILTPAQAVAELQRRFRS